jgi:hypothetical protein
MVMASDESPAGFLSRWSRRKVEVREGRALDEPTPASVPPAKTVVQPPSVDSATPAASDTPPQAPTPTLADAEQLTPDSDFTGFMARGVAPEVKNAAMKKLFADPHFNVMDRMDIYIDDYSKPSPLSMADMAKMVEPEVAVAQAMDGVMPPEGQPRLDSAKEQALRQRILGSVQRREAAATYGLAR